MKLRQHFSHAQLPELLTTNELAEFERVSPQTIRKNYCHKGHHHGLVPIKLPSGALRWLTADAKALMNGGQ
jgi:hypothetical protein